MTREQRLQMLKDLGFNHIIVRKTNMGVKTPGSIESAFVHVDDARLEASRLNAMYYFPNEDFPAFAVESLNV